jgi:dTDP-4-amino-4,6-dideoxygalactose transaminase
VYGNPCNHDAIQAIADQHQLKVIYDAAHAFGVKENKKSVLNYGDLSVLSFHATKVFNTFEGGAIICHSPEMKAHIDDLKNFGFRGETQVILPGINGKMNEVQAAMGLVQLKHFDKILAKRRAIYDYYVQALAEVDGIDCIMPKPTVELNASYFPIFVSSAYPLTRDELYEKLREENIFARRYFYPLVPDFKAYEEVACDADLPIARKKSEQVICLPIYPDLEMSVVERIVKVICNK